MLALSRITSHCISFTAMGCAHPCCARVCKLSRARIDTAQAFGAAHPIQWIARDAGCREFPAAAQGPC